MLSHLNSQLAKSQPPVNQSLIKATNTTITLSLCCWQRRVLKPKATQMLVEHVGTDLMRMSSELDKLLVAMPEGESRVSAALVEDQTGMSKDFNNFELLAALAVKNKSQAAKIVKYFGSNPRSFAMPVTLSMMFSFFADLMQAYYSPDKTDKGVAQWLGKPDWKVRNEIMPAMRCYTGRQVMEILSLIRPRKYQATSS